MKKPLLELTNLSHYFIIGEQKVYALKNINFTIYAGEMVAIVGVSGSGKSTLMNILGCLDKPSEGTYKIANQEVSKLSSDSLARLRCEYFGFIFQQYHLLPYLNVIQNIEMPSIYSGFNTLSRQLCAQKLLKRLNLSNYYEYLPKQLSGGQQQRVSIARALMNGGDVILADEPTGALDSKNRKKIVNILHELHHLGHTIVIITHNTSIANNAERIIEINDGIIVNDYKNLNIIQKKYMSLNRPKMHNSINAFQVFLGRFWEAFRTALIITKVKKTRTLLTTLGIIIGITAVVSVISIGQGARQRIIGDINSMGTSTIDIYPGSERGDLNAKKNHGLLSSDLVALKLQNYIDSVTATIIRNSSFRYRNNITINTLINGVDEQYFRVRGIEIIQGKWFKAQDIQQLRQVVVIDTNTSKKLLSSGIRNLIGEIIFIEKLPCQVIGIAKEIPFADSQNLNIWLPYTTAMVKLFGQNNFDSITVRIKEGLSNQFAEKNIIKLLKLRHRNIKNFFTINRDSILKIVKKTTTTMTLLISFIAVISLVVGGIGVMNVMLVSVSERTKEIGIRMAVGARQIDIMQQFLIESIIICLIGGVIGILLSYGIGLLFSLFITAITIKLSIASVIVAFFCSSLIGIIFGFLPASNAAKLNPIVALTREQ